jgi:hypothetical protein
MSIFTCCPKVNGHLSMALSETSIEGVREQTNEITWIWLRGGKKEYGKKA